MNEKEQAKDVKTNDIPQKRKSFKTVLKEAILAFRDIDFKSVTPVGYAVAIILVLAFAWLQFITIRINVFDIQFILPSNPILIIISIIIAFLMLILWIAIGIQFAGPFSRILVKNKIVKLLFTKGDVHYIEYVPEKEQRFSFGHVISKFIALLIVWASMAATLFTTLAGLVSIIFKDFNPANFIVLDNAQRTAIGLNQIDLLGQILYILAQILVIYILSPLILTFIVPLPWMLIDVKLKAFNSKAKINWYIGQKVQARARSIVSIAAIASVGASFALFTRIEVVLQMIALILVYMALPSIIVSLFYLLLFQSRFRKEITKACEVPFAITKVEVVEIAEEKEEEKVAEEEPIKEQKALEEPTTAPPPVVEETTVKPDEVIIAPTKKEPETVEERQSPPTITPSKSDTIDVEETTSEATEEEEKEEETTNNVEVGEEPETSEESSPTTSDDENKNDTSEENEP